MAIQHARNIRWQARDEGIGDNSDVFDLIDRLPDDYHRQHMDRYGHRPEYGEDRGRSRDMGPPDLGPRDLDVRGQKHNAALPAQDAALRAERKRRATRLTQQAVDQWRDGEGASTADDAGFYGRFPDARLILRQW